MGKPRLIIICRHAQSEGNKNREIHQTVPDHRVKLTPEGWKQAEDAGRKLRSLLHPSDTLHFFTSPYRRTRETTEGILNSLTCNDTSPSPFPRQTINVYEEPRLREQDFGNFQPNSTEMARMWHERANYGHFFYRIPNGESAADAYDRVSGFNESLWRSFGEDDFASVCVLVTHGLMTRVFLMKWYHYSVEYFEDLRNVNHCEFVVMKLHPQTGKYVLQNQLRTWSELRRQQQREKEEDNTGNRTPQSPVPVRKRWGVSNEWDEEGKSGDDFARRQASRRKNTVDLFADEDNHDNQSPAICEDKAECDDALEADIRPGPAHAHTLQTSTSDRLSYLRMGTDMGIGRDGGGSRSGLASPDPEASANKSELHVDPISVPPATMTAPQALAVGERRADALGDTPVDEVGEMDSIERGKWAERSVDGSVR